MGEKRYGTIITNKGEALIAKCILNGTALPITTAAAGDGGGEYYEPAADQTALRGECWRGEIAGFALNEHVPNMLDIKIIIDDEAGGFTVREMGLFTDDGVMIAVCNIPDTEKTAITDGVPGQLIMQMHIIVSNTSAVKIIFNPSLDTVNSEQLGNSIKKHNYDENAHAELFARVGKKVIAARLRDPSKTDYGIGGGRPETISASLEIGDYTETTDKSVFVSGVEYDAYNLSHNGEIVPDGNIIFSTEE